MREIMDKHLPLFNTKRSVPMSPEIVSKLLSILSSLSRPFCFTVCSLSPFFSVCKRN